jgi:TIR domain-containing protein
MRGRIFISYRRGDTSAEARSIYQRLERSFRRKRLFMDVDSISTGRDFGAVLAETLARSVVLLVIVGRNWLHARDDAGRRKLDDPNDFVRLEIVAALKRNIPVIPVLVERARMPKAEELPDDLKPLTRYQAAIVTHENFSGDMGRIERDLRSLLNPRLILKRIILAVVVSLIAIFLFLSGLAWYKSFTRIDAELPNFRELHPKTK